MRTIFDQPTAEQVRAQHRWVIDALEAEYPAAADPRTRTRTVSRRACRGPRRPGARRSWPGSAHRTSGKWRAATLSALVHAHGPGAGTVAALARVLGEADPVIRDRGVDALLVLAAHGELPAAELGQTAARMAKNGDLKLNRFAAALDHAVAAGAHAQVWEVIAATLRLLLAARQDKPHAGLADLIAVGTKAASRTRARTELPEIAALAERGGTSRTAREARSLRDLIGSFS